MAKTIQETCEYKHKDAITSYFYSALGTIFSGFKKKRPPVEVAVQRSEAYASSKTQ